MLMRYTHFKSRGICVEVRLVAANTQLAVCWRYWGLSPCISDFYWRVDVQLFPIIVALNGKKTTVEYVSSNQVVGSSNLSGRAIISMSYGALKN